MPGAARRPAAILLSRLEDEHNLWGLLVAITERKAWRQVQRERCQKRGGGQVRGDSVFGQGESSQAAVGFDGLVANDPTPEFVVLLTEQLDELLESLQDDISRHVALLKMQGYQENTLI